MFGSRLIQETRSISIPDPGVLNDIINFANNCTAYDIADGTIAAAAFSTSDNLWAAMAATNPARFTVITAGAGVTTTTCDAAYASISAPARTGQRVDGAPRAEAEPRPPRSGRTGGRPGIRFPRPTSDPRSRRSCYRS